MPQIKIAGHDFNIEDRYAEGHTLTANEAAALNQTRRENVRNNFASKVKKVVEEGGDVTSLQSDFDTFANGYEFGARVVGGASTASRDPVMTEARALARKAIDAALKAEGRSRKDIAEEKYKAAVEQLAQREDIMEQARTIAEQKKAVANVSLNELVSGEAPTGEATTDEPAAEGRRKARA